MNKKEKFISLLKSTNRKGVNQLLSLLEEKGFFEAPASTRFHLSKNGGLLQHSINVYDVAMKVRSAMIELDEHLKDAFPKDSVIIASLYMLFLRPIYKQCIKRQKNDNGSWVDTLGYDTDYSIFPLGHGEKTVIVLLRSGMELTDDEIIANRWHMNAWDLPFQSYEAKSNLNVAREHSPLLTLIQTADGLSSALIERTQRRI